MFHNKAGFDIKLPKKVDMPLNKEIKASQKSTGREEYELPPDNEVRKSVNFSHDTQFPICLHFHHSLS